MRKAKSKKIKEKIYRYLYIRKEKGEKEMKTFFKEFKDFITRGNVLDMAVGIIIGGAFTAIVTALTSYILTPLINWVVYLIFGNGGDQAVYTMLFTAYDGEGLVDLANSIYINWGAFIGAIVNFILIALVLFTIIRVINKVQKNSELIGKKIKKNKPSKIEKKEMKAAGLNYKDKAVLEKFRADKERKAKEEEEAKKAEEEAKAKAERLANPTTEDLLKDIKALLEKTVK